MAGNSREPGKSVISRTLAVLSAFDIGHSRLTMSEIARRAGLPLATAHRMIAELENWGALVRDDGGQYVIGARLWEVGLLSPLHTRLREIALPFMQDLYENTRENVHLAVRDGFEVLYVEKLTGHRAVSIISRAGGRLPMHTTGVGKALLAHQTAEFVEELCRRGLERCTPYSITEPGRLRQDLDRIRDRGYAYTREEMTMGNCSVAVPIRDENGAHTIAIGLVVRSVRADAPKLARAIRKAADGIQARLAQLAEQGYPELPVQREANVRPA
ncbi:IclR family transcriptional regulator [Pseudonocardiaceae bacterium YIM PH 21723]|nr:IclR family transcriptional regulator [Pseudonocardiaceae bacterium YIM PH 21723]